MNFFSLSPFKRILFTANPASHYTVDIVTQAVILDQSLNTFLEMFLIWSWCIVEVPGDCIGGWVPGVLQASGDGRRDRDAASTSSTATTMAREQPNVGDLLPLLETSDLHQLEEIRGLINEQLSTGRHLACYVSAQFILGTAFFLSVCVMSLQLNRINN